MVAIHLDGRVEGKSFRPQHRDEAREWIDRRQGKANLYFHVNELRGDFADGKAKKEDVVAAHWLHVDVDDPSPTALEHIRNYEPAATAIVFSGGGYQAFFSLTEPCFDLERAERCNLALAKALGGDNCHNIDRVMRLPGTLNVPNDKKKAKGRKIALAQVIEDLTDWSRAYAIDWFPELELHSSGLTVTVPPGEIATVDLDELSQRLSALTRTLVLEGDDPNRPIGSDDARYRSRSEALFRVTCDLVRAGLSDTVVAGVILNPKHGISASVREKKDPKTYAFRQIASARQAESEGWPDVFSKSGAPRPTLRNTILAIRRLGLHCEYDEFYRRKIISGHVLQTYQGELSDDGCAVLRHLIIEEFDFDPLKDNTREGANTLCLENTYHPIRDYLDAVRWDGTPRIDRWLTSYLGAENTPYTQAVGRLMLMAAVRRVRQPGIKFDQIIVLEGPQGSGKSTALRIMAGGDDNFSDADILTLDAKSQMEALEGVWIYEICELEGISRADTSKVKSFASRDTDRGRPAYGRFRENRPRQNILVGTTNDDQYLRDQTGNRRFWPVRTTTIDVEALARDRDQLWAEAPIGKLRRRASRCPRNCGQWRRASRKRAWRTIRGLMYWRGWKVTLWANTGGFPAMSCCLTSSRSPRSASNNFRPSGLPV